ncbi:hypothetical protein N431DRAFT_240036 [Stipitochalara longipes BDJ]|nr:hypothetical protein N431DRAFT_240036 [Stipitochalara longipes BDJ]
MRLLLPVARRARSSPWICHSCRGIKHATAHSHDAGRYSEASQQLRDGGPARTRFAPSPTGYLHLGSLRTALFNYLVAKATGGQFLLRIEDTDQKRTIPDAEDRLYEDLRWAGLDWDEGPSVGGPYGPYKQSERTALYRDHAEQLLDTGSAYRCFCTPERLRTLAEYQSKLGLPADYDRTCAHVPKEESDDRAAKGEAHVVRLKVPDDKNSLVFRDLVYGLIRPKNTAKRDQKAQSSTLTLFDDPVLLKSDGFPTYHLANVVDDHLMRITHVIRGSEWISSTPKHVAMYQAFGWKPPAFAHVGLLLDKNRQKLSKRTGSIDISEWRNQGIFPETLTNFVALLGWSHNTRSDIMSMEDLISNASMKYTTGDTVVGFEKLWFLQKRHAARYASTQAESPYDQEPSHSLLELAVKPILKLLDSPSNDADHSFYQSIPHAEYRKSIVQRLVFADAQNYTNPATFIQRNEYFFTRPSVEVLTATVPPLKLHHLPLQYSNSISSTTITDLYQTLMNISDNLWVADLLRAKVVEMISMGTQRTMEDTEGGVTLNKELELGLEKGWVRLMHQYLRWALVAGKPGPDSVLTMELLGMEETGRRLTTAAEVLNSVKTDDVDGETGVV